MQVVPFAGDATVFVSHCWGATWGDMVLAAASGARVARVVGSPNPARRRLRAAALLSGYSLFIVLPKLCDVQYLSIPDNPSYFLWW